MKLSPLSWLSEWRAGCRRVLSTDAIQPGRRRPPGSPEPGQTAGQKTAKIGTEGPLQKVPAHGPADARPTRPEGRQGEPHWMIGRHRSATGCSGAARRSTSRRSSSRRASPARASPSARSRRTSAGRRGGSPSGSPKSSRFRRTSATRSSRRRARCARSTTCRRQGAARAAAAPSRRKRARSSGAARSAACSSGCSRHLGAGTGHVALIEGEPGIGKSRLVRELARQARARGVATLATNCYEIERRCRISR